MLGRPVSRPWEASGSDNGDGGAGFVGSNIAAELLKCGRNRRVLVVGQLNGATSDIYREKWRNLAGHLTNHVVRAERFRR